MIPCRLFRRRPCKGLRTRFPQLLPASLVSLRDCLILSFPLPSFFSVAIPIAGLVFWLIFCLVRNLGERDLETSMGARLYSKELDGAFTNGALITRNAFRKAKKMHDKKNKKSMQASNQPKRGYSNSYAAYAAYAARSGKHH